MEKFCYQKKIDKYISVARKGRKDIQCNHIERRMNFFEKFWKWRIFWELNSLSFRLT